ncbi:tyrosine-type recombinase/integrase, partial [Idiomarina fontislapidosi]
MLTFVRSGELRGARWEEFDLDNKVWSIPSERMKMKRPHEVPLSAQALDVIKRIKRITGHYELLFPSETKPDEPMSDNTMRQAMFKMGYFPKAKDTKDGKIAKTYLKLHVSDESEHSFRFNPITHFGLNRSPVSVLSDH